MEDPMRRSCVNDEVVLGIFLMNDKTEKRGKLEVGQKLSAKRCRYSARY